MRLEPLILPLLLAGCSYDSLQDRAGAASDTMGDGSQEDADLTDTAIGLGEPGFDAQPFVIEVDPVPSTQESLLPSTFGPFQQVTQLDLTLKPAIRVDISVRGTYDTSWLTGASIPSNTTAPDGTLTFFDRTGLSTYETPLIEGEASLTLNPGNWTLAIRPSDPRLAAIDLPLPSTPSVSLSLPRGVSFWGRVLSPIGAPVPGTTVALVTSQAATAASPVRSDGWYEIRADASLTDASLIFTPPASSRLPTLILPITPAEGGLRQDLAWSTAALVGLSLHLVAPDGRNMPQTSVRITSESIEGYAPDAARWRVDAVSDSRGFVDVRLPAGVYTIETRPSLSQSFAAVTLAHIAVAADTDLGGIDVAGFQDSTFLVTDRTGSPLAGAQLRCREKNGIGRTFQARTEADGTTMLRVPEATLSCLASPPDTRTDLAAHRQTLEPSLSQSLSLQEGREIHGTVRVSRSDGQREPYSYAIVRAYNLEGEPLAETMSGDDGVFVLRVDDTAD